MGAFRVRLERVYQLVLSHLLFFTSIIFLGLESYGGVILVFDLWSVIIDLCHVGTRSDSYHTTRNIDVSRKE